LDELVGRLTELVGRETRSVELLLPLDRPELLARIHREGEVHSVEYEESGARVLATVTPRLREALAPFLVAPIAA
jgi:GTP-binding protein HflX